MKLWPEDVEGRRLMQQRKYYREYKIPALEKLLDWVKERIGPQAGMVPDGPGGCPVDADPWLVKEYIDMRSTLGEIQLDIADIETTMVSLGGFTLEELDELNFGEI
jgi:hypothetical protein